MLSTAERLGKDCLTLTLQRHLYATYSPEPFMLRGVAPPRSRKQLMLPECRTVDPAFAIPTCDLTHSDVAGLLEELWNGQSVFHDGFARSESHVHFF